MRYIFSRRKNEKITVKIYAWEYIRVDSWMDNMGRLCRYDRYFVCWVGAIKNKNGKQRKSKKYSLKKNE